MQHGNFVNPFPINIPQEILRRQRRLFWKDLAQIFFAIGYMMELMC